MEKFASGVLEKLTELSQILASIGFFVGSFAVIFAVFFQIIEKFLKIERKINRQLIALALLGFSLITISIHIKTFDNDKTFYLSIIMLVLALAVRAFVFLKFKF